MIQTNMQSTTLACNHHLVYLEYKMHDIFVRIHHKFVGLEFVLHVLAWITTQQITRNHHFDESNMIKVLAYDTK
jgi:hypothetical protein